MEIFETIILIIYGLNISFIFCYSLIQLQLCWLYLKAKKSSPPSLPTKPTVWPAVTVQLPLYNELYVVERLLETVLAFDYPAEKLQVQVLDDSTDNTTTLIAEKATLFKTRGIDFAHIRRPDRSGFKAGALQYGLQTSTGEFIAIFDADFLPTPDFLKQTISAFNHPAIGVVQTRWGHINQNYNWLTKLQAFGLNAHFTVEQTGRSVGGHFINFNGTGGVWRKSSILDAGGWEADTLTEDLDLSYRAQLRNWQFKYLENIEAPAELPVTMPALKSQQFRWTKGAAETARKNLGKVLSSNKSFFTKLNAIFHLLNSSIFIAVLLSALLSIPLLAFKTSFSFGGAFFQSKSAFIVSLTAIFSFYWISYRQLSTPSLKTALAFFPQFVLFLCLSMGLSLHNSIAVAEGYFGIKTPFIRTPKFNIVTQKDSWHNRLYTVKRIPPLSYLEALLCFYFLFGIYLAFKTQTFGMLPFHSMLSFGFGAIFYYSVKHSR
ncbi:cellulose synthase family protein [Adhaeribacter aquaticus]|uniref:cellulose synthase family protein n=1 Tax=Adhaeribacter aquaticus TaxID=299567 RepID=UPI0003FB6F25|nr:cellulose synthase family protein [Adhaeribacter aquaticus]